MQEQSTRFSFVDGLRGVAALLVVLPHSVGLFVYPGASWACRFMADHAVYGGRGVQIFFVISGFVIAYSLRDANAASFQLHRFVLRRSVRLDPPYWASLAVVQAAYLLRTLVVHQPPETLWGGALLAHLFYLQGILGYPQFNVVCWTLCIEFQLYLAYALLIMASDRLTSDPVKLNTRVRPAMFVGLFLASLIAHETLWSSGTVWFFPYFYMFLAGVLLCWVMLGRLRQSIFVGCLGAMAIGLAWQPHSVKASALLASGILYLAYRRGTLGTWLSGPPFRLLGRLSYCIYLLHVPVAFIVLGLRTRLVPDSAVVSFLMLGLIYALTIGLAYILHVTVEVPCLRLSARLKVRSPSKSLVLKPESSMAP